MRSSIRHAWAARIALSAVLTLAWHVACATAQPAPPDGNATVTPLISWRADAKQPAPQSPAETKPPEHLDRSVAPAALTEPAAPPPLRDPRRLVPQSSGPTLVHGKPLSDRDKLPFDLPRLESLTTAGAGLAIVLGLFLLCAWLVRRTGPKPTTPLPREAVAVLGRTPLAGSHFAHLVQFGNKLVLVSISPDNVSTLAEITDPHEVHRLLGLCLRNQKHSSTAEFQHMLEQLSREGGRGFLGEQAAGGYARAGRS